MTIKYFDCGQTGHAILLSIVCDLWNHQYGTVQYRGRSVILITGGWADNENIIRALRQNSTFWDACIKEEKPGGYYRFAASKRPAAAD